MVKLDAIQKRLISEISLFWIASSLTMSSTLPYCSLSQTLTGAAFPISAGRISSGRPRLVMLPPERTTISSAI